MQTLIRRSRRSAIWTCSSSGERVRRDALDPELRDALLKSMANRMQTIDEQLTTASIGNKKP